MINKLKWDSDFFGSNIASLSTENKSSLEDIEEYSRINSIDFIQTLCNIDDVCYIRTLEKYSFHFADIKITYRLDIRKFENLESFNLATPADSEAISNLASKAFVESRYYGHEIVFPKVKVDNMYRVWAEKSINGEFDDFCLKETKDDVIGFITAKVIDTKKAIIGIFAVDEKFQSKGVGTKLLISLMSYLRGRGVFEIEVSTQGKNIIAQNFYIKNGFRVSKVESWYYRYSDKLRN